MQPAARYHPSNPCHPQNVEELAPRVYCRPEWLFRAALSQSTSLDDSGPARFHLGRRWSLKAAESAGCKAAAIKNIKNRTGTLTQRRAGPVLRRPSAVRSSAPYNFGKKTCPEVAPVYFCNQRASRPHTGTTFILWSRKILRWECEASQRCYRASRWCYEVFGDRRQFPRAVLQTTQAVH